MSGDTTNPYVSPDAASDSNPYGDRSLGLVLFGVLQLLIGGFLALMVPFFVVAMFMPQPGHTQPRPQAVIPALAGYALLAAVFATLGTGSILARRWAWALTLVVSWLWLGVGLLAMAFVLLLLGDMFAAITQQQDVPPSVLLAMQIVVLGVLGCIYLVLPAAFVLFYRSPHVKATCERRDPRVRWTDRCPLPVLGLSVVLGLMTLGMFGTPLFGGAVPAFGTVLRGAPAALACLGMAVAAAWLARATYQQRAGAWWGCVALVVVLSSSTVVTFLRLDLMTYYEATGLSPEELDMMRRTQIVETTPMAAMSAVTAVAMLGYLMWIRKYFRGPAQPGASTSVAELPQA